MIFKLLKDAAKLTLIILCVYFSMMTYIHSQYPVWSQSVQKRRFTLLLGLTLAVIAMKIGEDVINQESGTFDQAVLLFIYAHTPDALYGALTIITASGSLNTLLPLAPFVALLLFMVHQRLKAIFILNAATCSATTVYLIKIFVDRDRPALWETVWYWGASFPSGHSLVVSTLAAATAISVGQIWPKARNFALWIGVLWLTLVAFSRVALGVHWPTDVLAAICLGMFIPIALSIALQINHAICKNQATPGPEA